MDNGQGRGIGDGLGRPAREAACRPNDRRAAVPSGIHGLGVCLYRLPFGDGLQDGRTSGVKFLSWARCWTALHDTSGLNLTLCSERGPWLQRADVWDMLQTRMWH